MVAGQIDAERLVFVDEMGTNTSLFSALRLGSEGREGSLLGAPQPRTEHDAVGEHERGRDGPCVAVEGATTAVVFETYVKKVLAPSLWHGHVVVMDNLSAHKGKRVRELVEARGCSLLYLPPYSPDLNPIERLSSKTKSIVRKAEARTRGALVEAMGAAVSAVTARDTRGFFERCGYGIRFNRYDDRCKSKRGKRSFR